LSPKSLTVAANGVFAAGFDFIDHDFIKGARRMAVDQADVIHLRERVPLELPQPARCRRLRWEEKSRITGDAASTPSIDFSSSTYFVCKFVEAIVSPNRTRPGEK